MKLWDRLKGIKRLGFVSQFNMWDTPPERHTGDYLSAYGQIYSLFGIALRIATAVSEVKWRLYKGSERSERSQISEHPILKLLDFANEFQTGEEVVELLQLHLDLAGKAYWYLPKNGLGVPAEVWCLPPHLVSIVPSKDKFIAGYIYGDEKIPIGTDEIIRFSMPDPLNPYGGIGYAQAAAVELDTELYQGKWGRNFFYNSARPDGALEYDGNLTEDQFKALKEQWASKHQGLSNAHKLAILEGGIKYKQIQIAQKDMDFLQGRKQTRENLLFTFGMPLSVMGISENVNRANAEAGDYTFARWLVKPRLTRIKNKLNEQLISKFPLAKGVEIDFDEVVPETIDQKKGLAESGVKAGYMTINEARKLTGLDDIPTGNVLLVPLNLIPTPVSGKVTLQPQNIPHGGKFGTHDITKLTPPEWEDEYAEGTPHWATDMNPSLFAQEFVEELKSNKLSKLLEVGCGNGRDSIFFSRAGMNVTAIDVSPSAIELAQSNAEKEEITNIRFMVANVEELPFADGEFESLFTLSVIHSTNLKKTIPQIARVVRKGGLVFTYLYADTEYVSGKVENHITVDDFINLLQENEFEIMDFYSEQEKEFDEYGEKHNILVSLLRR